MRFKLEDWLIGMREGVGIRDRIGTKERIGGREVIGWQQIYWVVWGVLNVLTCSRCLQVGGIDFVGVVPSLVFFFVFLNQVIRFLFFAILSKFLNIIFSP